MYANDIFNVNIYLTLNIRKWYIQCKHIYEWTNYIKYVILDVKCAQKNENIYMYEQNTSSMSDILDEA